MAITEWDDYFIHQIQGAIDEVESDDPHAFERTLVGCHDAEGTVHLMMGLGVYPNVNVMDGFVCVRYRDVQRNIFLSRHLQADRANTDIGPFSIKVLEPLKRLGIHLGDNDYGIECSLEFVARSVPWPREVIKAGGQGQIAWDQSGRFIGNITFEARLCVTFWLFVTS